MTPIDKCVRCGAPTYSGVQHICDAPRVALAYPVADYPPVLRILVDGQKTDVPVTQDRLITLAIQCLHVVEQMRRRERDSINVMG